MARTIFIPNPNWSANVRNQTEPQFIRQLVADVAKIDKTDESSESSAKKLVSNGTTKEKYKEVENFRYNLPKLNSAGIGLNINKNKAK